MITLEPYINFLIRNKITPEQFLLLFLLYKNRRDLIIEYKKAFGREGGMIEDKLIKDLIDRKFIVKVINNNNKSYYKLSEEFLKIFVDPDLATDEIYELYPPFITKENGVNIPLTSMDRRIFREIYMKKINNSIEEHKEVIKDIAYAINNKLVSIGINNFLTSEQWKVFRKRRLQDNPNKSNIYEQDF